MRDYLQSLKERVQPYENRYLVALLERSFRHDDFVETQIQFFSAVKHFWRPMLALAPRLSSIEQRLVVLENVYDEHGRGDVSQSHERTFQALLERLGVERGSIERRALWPEVRAFNAALDGVCAHADVNTALATLGVIEELFAGISARIGRAIVERSWLSEAQLIHYPAHEALDLGHAESFFGLLDQTAPDLIEEGLELGAHIFLRLYDDLFSARQRR